MAIKVAHSRLRDRQISVYFAPLRGMVSKEDLVSKLLSIFGDAKQVPHMSSSHWLIQCLQQVQNPFVLILDNAEDLLESEDAKRKQQALRFIDEIMAQCKHIKLLITTRESLDFLSHSLPIHLEKINILDEVSSARLVRLLLPDVLEDDCSSIVKECGQVPLAMRLMCSIMRDENVSINDLLGELKNSPLVEVLDSESFPDDSRLKTIINTSFQRLPVRERKAFVSLAVFPSWFRMEEATAVLDVKTVLSTKKIIRSLERKSLIDSGENYSHFTIHSLLRSFVDEERRKDEEVGEVFLSAQFQFYDYYISSFKAANEKFLSGHSHQASAMFTDRRESIILSLANGTRDERLYQKVVEVLTVAELFLYAVLPDKELLFEQLYDTAIKESKSRRREIDERQLLAAKSFRHWAWFSSDCQTWDNALYDGCTTEGDYPPKLLCYHAVHQILCGKCDEGISSLKRSVDLLSSSDDEVVLKALVCTVLEWSLRGKDDEMASYFRGLHQQWFHARLSSLGIEITERDLDLKIFKEDLFIFTVLMKLTSLVDDEFLHEDGHLGFQMIMNTLDKIGPAMYGNLLHSENSKCVMLIHILKETKGAVLQPKLEELFFLQGKLLLDNSQLESLFLCLQEFSDQILPGRLDSVQSYKATKQLMESFLQATDSFIVSPNSRFDFPNWEFRLTHEDDPFTCIFRTVLKENEKVPGRDLIDIAKAYDNFALLQYRLSGDSSGAIESHQHAIRLREEAVGDHVDTISSLTNIGTVYFIMNNAIEAENSFQRALSLRKRFGVYDHVDTAIIYFTLGENHYTVGDYEEALKAHLEASTMRTKHLGEHPLTARSFNELGRVHLAMESYPEALKVCQQALAMRLQLLGEHEDTATSFNLLGCIHFKMGENMSALKALETTVDMRSNVLGDHTDTASSYHNLGVVQRAMGYLSGALESLEKAWLLRRELLGDHPDTAKSEKLLNRVYEALSEH